MYYGVYRGVVSNTADPNQGGRVQVLIPAIPSGSSAWASTSLPPESRASYRSGQRVWVMFEGGDVSYPVIMGVIPGAG
jgi:hypothetical protein